MGLQAACGALMWRAYRLTGQSFGMAAWAFALLGAFFGNVLETPAGAIPFYLTLGLVIGPTLSGFYSPAGELCRPVHAYGFDGYHPNGAIHAQSADALVIQ
jgi:hypothetical protein